MPGAERMATRIKGRLLDLDAIEVQLEALPNPTSKLGLTHRCIVEERTFARDLQRLHPGPLRERSCNFDRNATHTEYRCISDTDFYPSFYLVGAYY